MNNYDLQAMVRAAIRRARFANPKTIDEFIQLFIRELELEISEAWLRQKGYI